MTKFNKAITDFKDYFATKDLRKLSRKAKNSHSFSASDLQELTSSITTKEFLDQIEEHQGIVEQIISDTFKGLEINIQDPDEVNKVQKATNGDKPKI